MSYRSYQTDSDRGSQTSLGDEKCACVPEAPRCSCPSKQMKVTSDESRESVASASKKSKEKKKKSKPKATSTPKSKSNASVCSKIPEVSDIDFSLPLEDRSAKKFTPIVYTFRIPTTYGQIIKGGSVRSPPYSLQLDHTLAVIWCLFSREKMVKPLGIVQLQWALNFLKGIYNRSGIHPKDVDVCIQAIEDELMEQYSSMVDNIKFDKSKSYYNYYSCYKSKKNRSSQMSVSSNQSLSCRQSDLLVTENVPFSINYAEMMKHNPKGIQQLFKASCVPCSISNASRIGGDQMNQRTTLNNTKSNDEMVQFLKAWRKEQIDKIQSELKRLHSIEDFISKADNCVPQRPQDMYGNTSFLTTEKPKNTSKKCNSSNCLQEKQKRRS